MRLPLPEKSSVMLYPFVGPARQRFLPVWKLGVATLGMCPWSLYSFWTLQATSPHWVSQGLWTSYATDRSPAWVSPFRLSGMDYTDMSRSYRESTTWGICLLSWEYMRLNVTGFEGSRKYLALPWTLVIDVVLHECPGCKNDNWTWVTIQWVVDDFKTGRKANYEFYCNWRTNIFWETLKTLQLSIWGVILSDGLGQQCRNGAHRFTSEQGFSIPELSENAPNGPDVDWSRIMGPSQQYLRCTIP